MAWKKEDYGVFLMGAGVLLIVLSVPLSVQAMAMVGIKLPGGAEVTASDLPPVSVSSLIAGIVLLLVGMYLKGFFKK